MKKIFLLLFITVSFSSIEAQESRSGILDDLERNKTSGQATQSAFTATTKSATRLFEDKNDLTSVITVIPSGSEVDVLGADSTYLRVVFDEIEGFIFKRHAEIKQTPMSDRSAVPTVEQSGQYAARSQPQPQPQPQSQSQQQESRFSYLENKYGTSMASSLIAGKIWRGMPAEMVRDSWGKPLKINRVISGNTVKEEWVYRSTWLYIEDDVLMTWGPVQK